MKYLLVHVKLTCNDTFVSSLGMAGTDWRNIPWRCIQCRDTAAHCIQWWAGVDMNSSLFRSYLHRDMEVALHSFD